MTEKPQTDQRAALRDLIAELTARMVKALDASGGKPEEEGKETASFANICSALDRVCDVYKLLNGTGDLDTSGSALDEYRGRMGHGGKNSSGRGNGHARRGTGNGAQRHPV